MQVASDRRFGIRNAGASITPADSVAETTPEVDAETERRGPTRFRDDGVRRPRTRLASPRDCRALDETSGRSMAAGGDAPHSRGGTDAVAAENEPTAAASVAVANDTACEGGIQ